MNWEGNCWAWKDGKAWSRLILLTPTSPHWLHSFAGFCIFGKEESRFSSRNVNSFIMENKRKQAAVSALLGEYRKAVVELQQAIDSLSNEDLVQVVDPVTPNPECISIQAILAHVISSGYSYCVYIENSRGVESQRPPTQLRVAVTDYKDALWKALKYTEATFENIYDDELEIFAEDKKIKTSWGQSYDIEQLMEHAIVHIGRHRRQVEKFKQQLQQHTAHL